MEGKSNVAVIIVALAILGAILALLYRSASSDDLPDDEWFDFEHA